MRCNRQLTIDKGKGDCFRACLTSILGIPNRPDFPNVDDKEWFLGWLNLLSPFGLELHYESKSCWRNGFWIASVKSKNFENTGHAIVMQGCKVAFDPSPMKRYRKGISLLGTELVYGGWYLEVTDCSKVEGLPAWRRRMEGKAI